MTDQQALPSIRRAAVAISRRTSLMTLGGTVLAVAIPGPSLVEAKKKGKKGKRCKRKNEDNENDQCEQQGPPCRNFADQFCALFHPPGPLRIACADAASQCCLPLEQYQGAEFFDCLLGRVQRI